jgi:tetratricopeptide (TPR) repeat protein
MTCWEFLKISPTIDTRSIKRAYAQLLRQYHPEEDPAGFQALRDAFEQALAQSKYLPGNAHDTTAERPAGGQDRPSSPHAATPAGAATPMAAGVTDDTLLHPVQSAPTTGETTPEAMVKRCMQTIAELYADLGKRREVSLWHALFEQQAMWPIDAKLFLGFHLFGFLCHHPWVPPLVWAMADEHFSWQALQTDLYKHFPEDSVDSNLRRIRNAAWSLGLDGLPLVLGTDYDGYLAHREGAYQAFLRGDIESTKTCLEQAADLLTGDPEWLRICIGMHVQAGAYDQALAQCQTLLRQSPHHLDAQMHQAHLLLDQGRCSEALHVFQALSRKLPSSVEALVGLARCHTALGNLFEAQSLLEETLTRCPDHIEAQMEMIRMCHLLRAGLAPDTQLDKADPKMRLRIAEAYFRTGILMEAEPILSALVDQGSNGDACLLYARVLAGLDRPEEALRHFDLALRHAQERGENQYRGLKHRGIFNYHQQACARAIEDLEQVRRMSFPAIDPPVWYHLADAYQVVYELEKAMDLFDALIDADTSEMKYYLARGGTLFDQKKYARALADFQTCLQLDYYCKARLGIAKCHVALKDYDQARQALDEAASFESDPGEIAYYRARCAFEQNDFETAREQIAQALEHGPNNALYHHLAAYLHRALSNQDQALAHFKACMADPPNVAYYGLKTANYCIEIKRPEEAVRCLQTVLEKVQSPTALLALSDIMFFRGKAEQSLRYAEAYFRVVDANRTPADPMAFLLRGRAKYAYHWFRPKKCLDDLRQAGASVDHGIAHFYSSLAYFDLRDIPNAEKSAREALAQAPDNEDFQRLVLGIEKYNNLGWFTRKCLSTKAIVLWPLNKKAYHAIFAVPPFNP